MTIINRISSQVMLNVPQASSAGGADGPAAPGQALFGTNTGVGTFTWTVPKGVRTVSAVAIGGGGGGPYIWDSAGGGGGGLAWRNNIGVTPGAQVTVEVGNGGTRYSFGAYAGGASYFINTSTCSGNGGNPGFGGFGGGYTGDGGGNGGNTAFFASPGAGAGGYTGAGGNGGGPSFSFGGGGGTFYSSFGGSGSGGGTGLRGTQVAPEGFGSSTVYYYSPYTGFVSFTFGGLGGGGGAGGGLPGQVGESPWRSYGPGGYTTGGAYGGGGGGSGTYGFSGIGGGIGGQGGVRIIWGSGRAFPGTLTDDV
jgi:hypothetical protein